MRNKGNSMKQVRWAGFAATITTLIATMVALPPAPATAAVSVADGVSSATAAPSCWAIKQSQPSSANGDLLAADPAARHATVSSTAT